MSEARNHQIIAQSNEVLELFHDIQNLSICNTPLRNADVTESPSETALRQMKKSSVRFFHVKQLAYDEEYPHREAFENVLRSLDNQAFNFVYILSGTRNGIELFVGVVENGRENKHNLDGTRLSAADYGNIVKSVFEGNFNGSEMTVVTGNKLDDLYEPSPKKYRNGGIIMGIPSVNEKPDGETMDFQGIDRLINSMFGLEWRLVVVCEPVSKQKIFALRENVYQLYNRLSLYSKMNVQQSFNRGESTSAGESESDASGRSFGYSSSHGSSHNRQSGSSSSSSRSSGTSTQEGRSEDRHYDHTKSSNWSRSENTGSSSSVTMEIANKYATEMMQFIDEELLERLKIGFSKGLFQTAVYYMAEQPTHANRLKAGLMSLFQGTKATYSPLFAQPFDLSDTSRGQFRFLHSYRNLYLRTSSSFSEPLLLLARPFQEGYMGLSTFLTCEELSLLAGLPQREVPGLALKEAVSFGLNEKPIDGDETISLGKMVQKGRVLEQIPFLLSRKSLNKHMFIAGVTGSGKTTTCHKLLAESNLPFLVVEPAKTEYRTLVQSEVVDPPIVFTLGKETVLPFRLNPFELVKGEIISAHIDMIKATFTSAFPMEGSMPQMLEEALIKCYENKGWDINNNINNNYEDNPDKAFDPNENSFPILEELLYVMESVVKSKGFGDRLQSEYLGSLISRLSNLTKGAKGRMLNCSHSVDFSKLIKRNVILEMEELKSPEDKALMMGFILSRLSAVIKAEHKRNPAFQHLTLIEEAHRLLSKVEFGDSGAKKSAVETFTDLLAEVRKYGEGLIIVDQIPNKLASEVLKNTNTKIIHKILARDDKDAVGDTMLMDDKQKEYLSALEVGHAIVFSEQTDKPVHIKIERISDTNEAQIDDEVVKEHCESDGVEELLPHYYLDRGLDNLYPLFCSVVSDLKHRVIHDENCKSIRSKMDDLALNCRWEKKKVWRRLVQRWGDQSGQAKDHSGKMLKQQQDILSGFFSATFYEPGFHKENLSVEILSNLW